MENEEIELDLELDARERAMMAGDLQEFYIEYWHQEENNATADDFLNYLSDSSVLNREDCVQMISETFGSYSDLVRSLGDIPQSQRSPQDEAVSYLGPKMSSL